MSFSFEKDLSAEAEVTGIVMNIIVAVNTSGKIVDRFSFNINNDRSFIVIFLMSLVLAVLSFDRKKS